MVKENFIFIGLMVIFILVFGGCATSRVERDIGNSLRQARSNQILNKDAGKNLELIIGLNGQVADTVMEEYRKSFTAERKKAEMPELTPGLGQDKEDLKFRTP